ncbi:potassium channel subfamily K member 12 [Cyanistes caeruleus]|nr:potassium channel subfamily K member 12 [Cyanistes caeruleus]
MRPPGERLECTGRGGAGAGSSGLMGMLSERQAFAEPGRSTCNLKSGLFAFMNELEELPEQKVFEVTKTIVSLAYSQKPVLLTLPICLHTVGFGMTTPATVAGKVFLIIYGLFGCAGTILFFNLFLERIISLLAFIMKACYERQLRRSGLLPANFRRGPAVSGVGSLVGWKPSVYHVMLILGIFAIALSCCASAMYTAVEGWNYIDSLYYCFVTFSTIGFGDLVSSQKAVYQHQGLYRFGNFMFILMGVCCIYSLFNVISIVIKQILNWVLKKFECRCCPKCHKSSTRLSRRNAITPGARLRRHNVAVDTDGQYDSDTEGRRLSGEMISMRELTASSKVSLAILQKQLSETANGYPRNVCINTRQNGFSAGVGALAIMNNRLAETSDSRQSRYQQYLDTDRSTRNQMEMGGTDWESESTLH